MAADIEMIQGHIDTCLHALAGWTIAENAPCLAFNTPIGLVKLDVKDEFNYAYYFFNGDFCYLPNQTPSMKIGCTKTGCLKIGCLERWLAIRDVSACLDSLARISLTGHRIPKLYCNIITTHSYF